MVKRLSDYVTEKDLITDEELENLYIEFLNEAYNLIEICGFSYEAGYALKKIDPIAFKVELNDWIEHQIGECTLVEKDGKYYRA